MDDASNQTSIRPDQAGEEPSGTSGAEERLIALLTQTNQLLQALLNALKNDGKLELQEGGTNQTEGNWLARWTRIVNHAFEEGSPREVCQAIRTALAQNGQPFETVDFNDVVAYEQDRSYALFALSDDGCCFLVQDPESDKLFAAFPYPSSATWFLMGKLSIKAMYRVLGAESSYAPKIRVVKPAILQSTGSINAKGNPILTFAEKGELVAQ